MIYSLPGLRWSGATGSLRIGETSPADAGGGSHASCRRCPEWGPFLGHSVLRRYDGDRTRGRRAGLTRARVRRASKRGPRKSTAPRQNPFTRIT